MSVNYVYIGWCHEDSHDKVWGVIKLSPGVHDSWERGNYVTFWGRRGRKLSTKIYADEYGWELTDLFNKKVNKGGYKEVDLEKLNEVYPEFEADLKKLTFWSQFKV
jgi:hypothetical protein